MKWRSLEESTTGADTRTLGEVFAERKELIAKYVPAETQAIHARVIAGLKENRLAENILSVGSRASAFELRDHNNKVVSSADLLSQTRQVICFFSRALVSFLCWTTRSHESDSAAD